MHANEFSELQSIFGKSRKNLAAVLGVSAKAVESKEQGWRQTPVQTASMLYYLLNTLKSSRLADASSNWQQLFLQTGELTALRKYRRSLNMVMM